MSGQFILAEPHLLGRGESVALFLYFWCTIALISITSNFFATGKILIPPVIVAGYIESYHEHCTCVTHVFQIEMQVKSQITIYM